MHYPVSIMWMTSWPFASPESSWCQWNLDTIKHMYEWLGIPLAQEKVKGPQTSLKFLSIILDALQIEALLPANKLQRIRELRSTWMFKKSHKRWDSLIHRSAKACYNYFQPDRAFLSRMYATADKLQELHFCTRLNKEFLWALKALVKDTSKLGRWNSHCK